MSEPLTSAVVGVTAILILVLAIVALLLCLVIAEPKPPASRYCPDCRRELEPSGRCRYWTCPKTPHRIL